MADKIDIIDAIREERSRESEYLQYSVQDKRRDGAIWTITVADTDSRRNEIDESLEGARVWWKGTPNGSAEVLSVVSDESKIHLRFASTEPPPVGEKIRIYPPKYLEALEDLWMNDSWAEACCRWLADRKRNNRYHPALVPNLDSNFQLRRKQKDAFKLLGYDIGFLHGPPGTGKTTTLGAIIAQYLLEFPKNRVILLSTTNLAVDEALVSVDRALERCRNQDLARKIRKNECKRLGYHFVASNYQERGHLLPPKDENLIRRLVKLESERPDPEFAREYAEWKSIVESLRRQMKAESETVLEKSRLIGLTTTRAVWTFETLRQRFPAELIVFDESSQVGQAHALALAPLGKRCLFTGDPHQLAPIVKSDRDLAQRYLGKSMFAYQREFEEATVFLDEQSRMTEEICHVVSKTFYGGKLKVAGGCGIKWHDERDIQTSLVEKNPVSIQEIAESGTYSQKYGGYIRYQSAKLIHDLTISFLDSYDLSPEDLLILTPFRAQRRLIRSFFRKSKIRGVKVNTVHRSQGSECHTVIFDPVDASTPFLNTDDAKRLMNVAISRAKSRLIICVSESDKVNPTLNRIYSLVKNMKRIVQIGNHNGNQSNGSVRDISDVVAAKEFPFNALNKEIRIAKTGGDIIGKVTKIVDDGSHFMLFNYQTGRETKFKTEIVIRNVKS